MRSVARESLVDLFLISEFRAYLEITEDQLPAVMDIAKSCDNEIRDAEVEARTYYTHVLQLLEPTTQARFKDIVGEKLLDRSAFDGIVRY